jgi:DNA-binding XRE family transcriptional regulator
MNMDEFWNRVNELLKTSTYTQETMAETIGVSKNTLYSWIARDIKPRADESVKIAQALGVSVEYLVTGEKPDNTAPVEQIRSLARQILDETDKIT